MKRAYRHVINKEKTQLPFNLNLGPLLKLKLTLQLAAQFRDISELILTLDLGNRVCVSISYKLSL